MKFIESEEKKWIKIIKEISWNTLYWHWTWINENCMSHMDWNSNYWPWTISWKTCDFYLQNPNFPQFSFITSWDDLATYNIAKKWLEYINNLSIKNTF